MVVNDPVKLLQRLELKCLLSEYKHILTYKKLMTINIITLRKAIFLILDARQKDNLVNKHEFTKVSTDYKGDASLSTQCSE